MNKGNETFNLTITETNKKCQIGETVAMSNILKGAIPVMSCEGGCIKGEIARLAANMLAQNKPFKRACHGELLSVPDSTMASWIMGSEKVVLIDGCFIRCHGRMLENLIDKNKLVQFDALSLHRKYADLFDIDSVPEKERMETASFVADIVSKRINDPAPDSDCLSAGVECLSDSAPCKSGCC